MAQDYESIARLVSSVRRRWRGVTALRAWTRASIAGALALTSAFLVSGFGQPRGGWLVLLWFCAVCVALGTLLTAAIVWTRRRPGDLQVARFIEERCPELEDTLATAVAHGRTASTPMSASVLRDAAHRTRQVDAGRVVEGATMRGVGARAAAATLAYLLAAGLAAGPAAQAAGVLMLLVFPNRLDLQVTPGDVKVRAGEPLHIVARVAGGAAIVPVLRSDADGAWAEHPMTEGADGFTASMDRVEQDFRYVVAAAGVASREYQVTVLHPPGVDRIDLHYEYPGAFGMPPRDEADGGDIYGPSGTRVRVTVRPNKAVSTAALTLSSGSRIALTPHGDTLRGELTIGADDSYRVALTDADGLANPGDTEYFIRTLQDRPPDVRIVRPAHDRQVTSLDEVTIDAAADDDFGVAAFDLVYSVGGGAPKTMPFTRSGPATAVTGSQTLYLEELGVRPGDVVAYYARARDVGRGKRPSEARSDIFFLEIAPFEGEFVASESMGGGGGGSDGLSLEELIQGQKDVITATWNLDRRARESGARSAEDTRTVANGQRELHGRAARVFADMERADTRRRRLAAGRGGTLAATGAAMVEAVGRAVAAMASASQQLDRSNTTEALPHEMTSLNELLRAQAEVRRREVQLQANGPGGGMANRSQQDMSSLFDQELAREQQTSYEQPPSAGSRDSQNQQDDALDQIGELARRQDELSRKQEKLSKNTEALSPEERKRELERLMKEQSELRRQVEELAREMQQRAGREGTSGGREGSGSRAEGGRQTSQDLQQASEDMEGAASELRRENLRQASERGSRAADRLRDAEQRMRGQQPDDRRRALGELQLESRQLADAERRLADDEAARGRGATPSDRARQRAAEQERLADRAERLEQGIRRLAQGGEPGGREDAAIRESAESLDRQRIAERMREAARQDREAAQQGGPAGGRGARGAAPGAGDTGASSREREQIARALDEVADRLAAAGGQDGAERQLAEDLSRVRRQREELAALDRQLSAMRERAAGQSGGGRQAGRQSGDGGAGGHGGGNDAGPWESVRELLDDVRRQDPASVPADADTFNPGRSAPGTEAWKQDFAAWDELKVQLSVALERTERTLADRARGAQSRERLSTGASQRVPESYRQLVERYFRSLAAGSDDR